MSKRATCDRTSILHSGSSHRSTESTTPVLPGDTLTKAQIRKLVLSLRDITAVLAEADPKFKAEVYAEL
jgi:hypothetical protein